MLRQIIVIFVWLSCFYLPLTKAEEVVNAESARQMQDAPKRGALFKIGHAGNTLFLFGTIHIGEPGFYPLEPIVTEALAQSTKIALELDPRNTGALQQAVLQYGFFPKGAASPLAPELQVRLTAVLKKYGVPETATTQMKPWMLVVMLTMQEYAAEAYSSELAVDAHLSEFARTHRKPVVELETVKGQLALFDNLPMADQLRFLDETLADIESHKSTDKVRQLVRMWREADAAGFDALAREMAQDGSFSGRFMQRELLDARNPTLADSLEKLLRAEKQAFAGIGVLHLIGKGSVPALLRQRGYAVERIY